MRALHDARLPKTDAVEKGAQVVAGGACHPLGGTFFMPSLLTGMRGDMLVTREETFGPLAALLRFETEEEVLEAANDAETSLAAQVHAQDVSRIFRMVGVNTGLISTELAPFGGVEESGNSRKGSAHGLHDFTEFEHACIGGLAAG